MGWDYCSPKEGLDYSGKECRPDHFCDKHGQDSYWCYVDSENNWGYCSIEGESKHLTERGYYCTTECEMNGENYFWCRHNEGWGYCSLTENSDSHGRACRADHDCGKHDGTSYAWCKRNEENEWDYCGQISAESQNVMLQQNVMDTVMDKGNCVLTEWILLDNNDLRPRANVNGDYIIAARELIMTWKLKTIARKSKFPAEIDKNELVRIDLQKMYDNSKVCFANIQIQMNIPRVPGESTTIAMIQLQAGEDFPPRYIRRALRESLDREMNIKLQEKKYSWNKKLQKCDKLIKYGDTKKCPFKKPNGQMYS